MKKILALLMVMIALAACTNTANKEETQKEKKPMIEKGMPGYEPWMEKTRENTKLTQYVDSITKVYPNFEGNLVVQKTISKDFQSRVNDIPGILEGSTFHFASMFENGGKTCVAFICNEEGVNVWCLDYDENEAVKLDKSKAYEISGGTLDHFEMNDDEIGSSFLFLGNIYVRNLKVEEI